MELQIYFKISILETVVYHCLKEGQDFSVNNYARNLSIHCDFLIDNPRKTEWPQSIFSSAPEEFSETRCCSRCVS